MNALFYSWGMLILSVIFNAAGVFIIKLRLNELGAVPTDGFMAAFNYFFEMIKAPLVCLGLVLFILAPFLFTIALSRMEIAIAYPVQVGLNFVILILLAALFLGEQITAAKMTGIALIMIGIFFLNKTT